ncbi:MAG: DUF1365 domain-containing protein [Rhodospirillales bacterium]|nr:DUF1365 domain-containing protein [Rhodospirillales bacterium]
MLLSGRVAHVRHVAPRRHFSYRLWMLGLDIDRIEEVAAHSRIFRANRAALLGHRDRDHGARDGSALRPWVEAELGAAGLTEAAAQVHLVAIPRIAGYAFNPISFYFCHDRTGVLRAIIHEVKNTFGGQTAYVLAATPEAGGAIRQATAKRLHVSPFFDMDGGYRFAVRAPDFATGSGRLAIGIRYGTAQEARLTATMRLDASPYGDAAALALLARLPGMALKVTAAIHLQALRLWLGGARFHPLPPAAPPSAAPQSAVHQSAATQAALAAHGAPR